MKNIKLMDVVKAVHAIDYTAENRDIEINNVEFDSRQITPGSLFVPLTSGKTDGHEYIQKAIENGAIATFWSKDQAEAPSEQIACIFVDDTLEAMQALAKYYRDILDPIVIGITGSNGKTTTKDMTANALMAKYQVHKTQGNYNNEIGLPYTLLQMPETTEVVVCEMGMSGFGEIKALSEIAQPDIAVITLIGESHLEFLGSRAGIAQAKLEILSGLKESGLFIYPGDEPLIQSEMPELNKSIDTLSIGFDETSDVYAKELIEEQSKTYFKTNLDENVLCMIPVMGAYNVSNALIALSIAKSINVPIEQAIFQLSQFKLTANRLEWLEMKNGAQLLNDAYNASPTSMRAVLQAYSTLQTKENGRKIAVLGDIRELGPHSEQFHREIVKDIDPQNIDVVYLFGEQMQYLYEELKEVYDDTHLIYEPESHQKLIEQLENTVTSEDMVLVKSSFGVDLLKVVTHLTSKETQS
ncbi:UDP-N-acetylmuramoyl-tripeptide--D-alanyl-D-alanine ligase [Aerococcaceae bacterium INB8]|uniref:UDP-N-acetylmuramoyl-tripeptide--D-alanyl-D-alanine ligase n=1 Tax=Ruoffia halotolerans TaxID=2748684 RepID=A0A839A7C6_9LACT|nr:UDP-N-acetylmuramoyl-tripeptide--D-alanyl-D-alanine ligase [Ruoffia halotolerans]MBA5729801.1 UDP-N-acetylmuramoyl-tripeptide--D-alanyl-D-alanine ligase [Ruoffia halotolerans]